jgi:VWFA-related protein
MGIVSARRFSPVLLAALLGGPIVLSGALSGRLSAQSPTQGTVFRSNTQIVRVDAVVVDKDGRPVKGLTKDDFEILDRKTLRPVESLEELSYDRSPAPAGAALPERLTRADNSDAAADRRVILVIDEPRVMISRSSRARDVAKSVVRELGGRVQIALLRTNGELACEFTKDTRLLLDTIDDIEGEKTYFKYRQPAMALSVAAMYDNSAGGYFGQDPGFWATPMAPIPNLRDRGVYRVLGDAARTLSYDSGRRTAVVLVSEGHPIVPVPVSDFDDRMTEAWRRERLDLDWMVTSARNANVAVYAIDPRGKGRPGEEGYAEGRWMAGFSDDYAKLAQGALKEITELTGGFAFTGSDDFAAGASKILDELDHYYLLGFAPENPNNSSPRQITVRVKKPGLTVRHRQYFSAATAKSPKFPKDPTTKDWLQSLAADVTPRAGLPVSVSASVTPGAGGRNKRVAIVANAGAGSNEPVDLGLWVIDVSKTKVSKQSDLPLLFAGPSATREIELAPGRYQIRLAARERNSGKSGSAYLMVDVPK